MSLSIFLLSNIHILSAQYVRLRWDELKSPTTLPCTFVAGHSLSDFWMSDGKGSLFHWTSRRWHSYAVPLQQSILLSTYFELTPRQFLCAATDKEYRTKYFIFNNGAWKFAGLEIPTRAQQFIQCSDGSVLIWGDWGTLLRYHAGEWTQIPTPFKNHIIDVIQYLPHEYWLAVRGEGVFRYNEYTFHKLDVPKQYEASIVMLNVIGKDIYAATTNQQVLKYVDGALRFESQLNASFLNIYKEGKFGFVRVDQKLPTGDTIRFEFPKHYKASHHQVFNDSSVLLTTLQDKIYTGTPCSTGYYVNLSNLYDVGVNPDYNTTGASIFDINDDLLQDIFVFNPQLEKRSKLYLNDPQQPMVEEIEWLRGIDLRRALLYSIGDLNNDDSPDFILTRSDTSGLIVELYEQRSHQNYSLTQTFTGSVLFNHQRLTAIHPVDYDGDGDLDLAFTHYFSPTMTRGSLVFLRNSWWGGSFTIDTFLVGETQGWNLRSVFADFNGDNQPEWFVTNRWGKNRVIQKVEESWISLDSSKIGSILSDLLYVTAFADFDVDGDLDIIALTDSTGLQYYQNNGKGFFSNVSTSFFDSKRSTLLFESTHMSIGDVNNDSYPDIFIGGINNNHLFINRQGKYFHDMTAELGLTTPNVHEGLLGDIDSDGDLDVFGYNDGVHALWINTQNDSNYVAIDLRGILSNSEGKNSSVWIYEHGYLNNRQYLRGYQQTGVNHDAHSRLHFGLPSIKTYDIKIQFFGGKERILTDIRTAQMLEVREIEGVIAYIYLSPGMIFQFMKKVEVRWYGLFILCGLLVLWLGARYGIKEFNWKPRALFVFITANLLLYWGISALTSSGKFITKYLVPLFMVSLGSAMPNLIYFWARSHQPKGKHEEELKLELLHTVVEFMHGEWAMRSLNSLILYCNDLVEVGRMEPQMIQQLHERRKVFLEMTKPRLEKICALAKQIRFDEPVANEMERQVEQAARTLELLTLPTKELLTSASVSLQPLKSALTNFRDHVLASNSCDPFEVVKQVIHTLHPESSVDRTPIITRTTFTDRCRVLIHNYELADILDNSIRNAQKAIRTTINGTVEIRLYRSSPKICLDIIDTGVGIAPENLERIFERGYSELGGTGLGLPMSRSILQKYGGRIFVKKSEISVGTTFTIELYEVPLP